MLIAAMDVLFAALEGDQLDHLLAGLVEILVTVLLPALLVVVAFGLATRSDQMTVGIVAGTWELFEELLFQANLDRASDVDHAVRADAIFMIVLSLVFLSVALGPWVIGRIMR